MNNKKLKQTFITDYYPKDNKEKTNFCVECGIDMGPQNPRQLCGKSRCYNIKIHLETYKF